MATKPKQKPTNPARAVTRGVRNNNPLNIRVGNTWLGEVTNPTDSEFEQFVSVKYGLRAAFCILRRYIRRYQSDTIHKIVSRWAPKTENDTANYIQFVSKHTGIEDNALVDYYDEDVMCKIVHAMALMESNVNLDMKEVHAAYHMA